MKYRKKPVVIEAVQWNGHNPLEIGMFAGWLTVETNGDKLYVPTLEGTMMANPGDYIIKGIQDEFYPCKPDIFEATYEKVE